MKCQHQFNHIKEMRGPAYARSVDGASSTMPEANVIAERWDDRFGAMSGCPICGEVRIIWEDGTIEIKVKAHGATNNPTT